MGATFSSARTAFSPLLPSPSFPNPVSTMDRLFEQPLNGLTVKRKGTGDAEVEGTVVSSTIRGRPTQDTPFVASEYLVEWMDGRIESGLSREAVLKMSQNRWTSSAWADAFFETHDVPAAPLEVLGAPSASTSYRTPAGAKTASSAKPKLAAYEPSPVKNLIGVGNASLAGRQQLYVTQDKSKIGCAIPGHPDAIKREQQRASALAVSASAAAAAAAAGKAVGAASKAAAAAGAGSQAAGGLSKVQGKKEPAAGKKKRKAKNKDESDGEQSDPEPEEEEEQEEEGGDGEVPEFMRRQYPRDVTFTEGDTPLSVYKNQEEDPDAEFEIQAIVDETVYGRQKYVLVKWHGYELDVTDWSLIADVKHTDIYKEWSKKRKADERLKKKGKTEGGQK